MRYQTQHWIQCRFERDDGRYYQAVIEQDLLGNWVVRRVWGGIGKPAGTMTVTPCEDLTMARTLLRDIQKRRQRRHYQQTH